MEKVSHTVDDYKVWRGLDKRTDKSLIGHSYFLGMTNTIIERGVVYSRQGDTQWGTLDDSAQAGTRYSSIRVDVGTAEWILLHKGTQVLAGLKGGAYAVVLDLNAVALAPDAAESIFEHKGKTIGSGGVLVHKVILKQADGCITLEFNGTTWAGRNTGIENDFTLVADALGSATGQRTGSYRVRMVACRIVSGIRTNESAPGGEAVSDDGALYQEVELVATTEGLRVTLTHSSPDEQITHYIPQVTDNLDLNEAGLSNNGHDPEVYYELAAITKATALGGPVTLDLSILQIVVPDTRGLRPLPGHLISHYSNGITWFVPAQYTSETNFLSRIYRAGAEGYFYHSELYNPFEWIAADESDGQDIIGLGPIGDHLVVLKEARTGYIPNISTDSSNKIVWRDNKLGISHRKAFFLISEDEMIVLNQDGIIRRFNAVEYDRKQSIGDSVVEYSENIRTDSIEIDPSTIDWMFFSERLHLIYTDGDERKALVLHPRESMAWTEWDSLSHLLNLNVNNGLEWVFIASNGKVYQQDPGETYTKASDSDALVSGMLNPCPLYSSNHRNILILDGWAVEGYFQYIMSADFEANGAEITGLPAYAYPDPELPEHVNIQIFNIRPEEAVYGNYIRLKNFTWQGKMILRAFHARVIESVTGKVGQPIGNFDPEQFLPSYGSNVLVYLKFNEDSGRVLDYSGNRHHHTWNGGVGGSRSHVSSLAPGGGESYVAGTDSELADTTWTKVFRVDADGYLEQDLLWDVGSWAFPTLGTFQLVSEGPGSDGESVYKLWVDTDGSVHLGLLTYDDALNVVVNKHFYTDAAEIIAGSTLFSLRFQLSNSGLNGQWYVNEKADDLSELLTTTEDWI